MAINQIGVQPKQEESAWDKIAKVMGFAASAVGVASDVNSLVQKSAPPSPQTPMNPPNVLQRRRGIY